jgi:hypothetical protein
MFDPSLRPRSEYLFFWSVDFNIISVTVTPVCTFPASLAAIDRGRVCIPVLKENIRALSFAFSALFFRSLAPLICPLISPPYFSSNANSFGNAARTLSCSGSPAKTPATKGLIA